MYLFQKRFIIFFFGTCFLYSSLAVASLGFHGGGFFGLGEQEGEERRRLQDRKVYSYGLFANPYITLFSLVNVGPYLEYHIVEQRTKAAKVGFTDVSGKGYLIGPSVSGTLGPLFFLAAYTLFGSYEEDTTTAGGSGVELEKPRGIHATVGVSILPFIRWNLTYMMVKYKEESFRGVTTPNNNPREWKSYRTGISIHF